MNMDGKNLLVRVFNAEGDAAPRRIAFEGHADKVELIGLDGQVVRPLQRKEKEGKTIVTLSLPHYRVQTIRFSGCSVASARRPSLNSSQPLAPE